MEDRILFREMRKQGGQSRQLALNGGRRTGPPLQVLAPRDHMRAGHCTKFFGALDADKVSKLAEIMFIGFAGIGVAEIGKPLHFRGNISEFEELRRCERPTLPSYNLNFIHPPPSFP